MKVIWKILAVILVILLIVLVFAGNYFYHYAVVPSKKDFLAAETPGTNEVATDDETESWFKDEQNRTRWTLQSDDGLRLSAIYLPSAQNQQKTAIIAHGYMGNAETMADYAKMYHDFGYNVLVPDARGHGESEGDYIGFGWPERKDYLQWIDRILNTNGDEEEIALFGISMGAATVMMTSGENLPANVTSIVEDCGYSSVEEELSYQLHQMFQLPSFPLIQVTSLITRIRAGYFFEEASAVNQLEKNQVPMFFIHGDADDFVPFSMLEEVYESTSAPKEKWVVEDAGHAQSYGKDPVLYQKKIVSFLSQHTNQ